MENKRVVSEQDIEMLVNYAPYSDVKSIIEEINFKLDEWGLDNNERDSYIENLDHISNVLLPEVASKYRSAVPTRLYELMFHEWETAYKVYDLCMALIEENIDMFAYAINRDFYDWLAAEQIETPELWEELADRDLRVNGIDASCLDWVKQIDHDYEYNKLNAYQNAFEYFDTKDVLEEFIIYYISIEEDLE